MPTCRGKRSSRVRPGERRCRRHCPLLQHLPMPAVCRQNCTDRCQRSRLSAGLLCRSTQLRDFPHRRRHLPQVQSNQRLELVGDTKCTHCHTIVNQNIRAVCVLHFVNFHAMWCVRVGCLVCVVCFVCAEVVKLQVGSQPREDTKKSESKKAGCAHENENEYTVKLE